MKVEEIKENTAKCDYFGNKRDIRIDIIPELKVGEYVLVHAGFAISKLKEEEGRERLEALKEVEEALKG